MVADWKEHQWIVFKILLSGQFPGSPVLRTPAFTAEGTGSIPGQGTKIPQAAKKQNKT